MHAAGPVMHGIRAAAERSLSARMVDLRAIRALRRVTGGERERCRVNAIALYRRMARMWKAGLSETEIGVRCHVRQWTVSRVLELRTMDDSVMRLFAGREIVTLAALREVASWPEDVQRAALGELVRLVDRNEALPVSRPDVLPIMHRHGRDLDRAPFPTAACRACAKRSGAQMDFFGDVEPGVLGRCADAACFARCMNAVSARRARWAGHKKNKEKQQCISQ